MIESLGNMEQQKYAKEICLSFIKIEMSINGKLFRVVV